MNNKIQKFLSKHKIVTVSFALPLLVIVSLGLLYAWQCCRYETSLGHSLMHPGQKVSSPVCSFVSPNGWKLTESKDYDLNRGGRFAVMSRWLFEKTDKFSEKDRIAFIALCFREDYDEEFLLRAPIGRFLQEVGSSRTTCQIDGEHIIFYRYEGPNFMESVKDGQYVIGQNLQYESISIGFCSDFGFDGMFWGLPEHEEDFWSLMESIQWKL